MTGPERHTLTHQTEMNIGDLTHDAVGMLRGMVAIPSPSFEETAVRDYISGVLEKYGIRHETVKNNIVAPCNRFIPGRKTLMLARAGKLNGYMIEGMGCPGGCVAGVGTIIDPAKAKVFVDMQVKSSEEKIPPKELEETAERLTKMS